MYNSTSHIYRFTVIKICLFDFVLFFLPNIPDSVSLSYTEFECGIEISEISRADLGIWKCQVFSFITEVGGKQC